MEQRGRSAGTVSCQPLSALVSLRESPSKSSTVSWSTHNNNNILLRSIIHGCSLDSLQVGTCQSNLSVSNPPHRPAFTQCYLLRHCRTPARLHGHPPTDRHPVHKSPERRVSFPSCFCKHTLSNLFPNSGRKIIRLFHREPSEKRVCVFICFSESWSCRGRAQPQTLPKRNRKQSPPWVLTHTDTQLSVTRVWHYWSLLVGSAHLTLLGKKNKLLFLFFLSSTPPPSYSYFFSLGSLAGSADAGICEENHRSGGIKDGWENTHTHTNTVRQRMRLKTFLSLHHQSKLLKKYVIHTLHMVIAIVCKTLLSPSAIKSKKCRGRCSKAIKLADCRNWEAGRLMLKYFIPCYFCNMGTCGSLYGVFTSIFRCPVWDWIQPCFEF